MAACVAETLHYRLVKSAAHCSCHLDRYLRCRVVPAGAVKKSEHYPELERDISIIGEIRVC